MTNNLIRFLQQKIDQKIKKVWQNNIKSDYNKFFLLKEDTLKNSLYFHLRNELTDQFLEENNLRIYTEFHYKGFIADLAIVQLSEQLGKEHLQDEIKSVLAIIEVKYKNGTSDLPFNHDVEKIKQYLAIQPIDLTLYYLAFVQEAYYEPNWSSWLTDKQKIWAKDRVTELTGYFVEGQPQPVWRALTHN
jgi:hypothetical protein